MKNKGENMSTGPGAKVKSRLSSSIVDLTHSQPIEKHVYFHPPIRWPKNDT